MQLDFCSYIPVNYFFWTITLEQEGIKLAIWEASLLPLVSFLVIKVILFVKEVTKVYFEITEK